ncbi:MAG: TonB-dependent receptor [Aureispira sp.]|nr:TonB-dependent receptor [Aureispira sp.]
MKGLLTYLLLICIITVGQTQGSIRGKVMDKETGENVVGATVLIKQTGQAFTTDLDGNFVLRDVKPGLYDVECSYLGYGTQRVLGVQINDDRVKLMYFRLMEGEAREMNLSVTVTAQTGENMQAALLARRKKSMRIMETLSAEEIMKMGDENVAEALQHFTNVTVEENSSIYIRGLGNRYVKTLLNGAEVPGVNINTGGAQLDIFPSAILGNIIVYKNYSPEMVGGFGGGYVDISTKSFPDRFTVEFNLGAGINTLSAFNPNFLHYKSAGIGFFGFLGSNDVPIGEASPVPSATEAVQMIQDGQLNEVNQFSEDFAYDWTVSEAAPLPHLNGSFMIGNQTTLKNGHALSYGIMLLYKTTSLFYDNGFSGRYELAQPLANTYHLQPILELTDQKSTFNSRSNTFIYLAYKSRKTKIVLNAVRNHNAISAVRLQSGEAPLIEQGLKYATQTLISENRAVFGGQARGTHLFGAKKNIFDWSATYNRSFIQQPNWSYFVVGYKENPNTGDVDDYLIADSIGLAPTILKRNIDAHNVDVGLNLTLNFQKKLRQLRTGLRGTLKLQFFLEDQFRYFNNQSQFGDGDLSSIRSAQFSYQVEDFVSPSNFIQYTGNASDPLTEGVFAYNAYDSTNNYVGLDFTPAWYIDSKWQLSERWKLSAGIRIELFGMFIDQIGSDLSYANASVIPLPSLAASYDLGDKMYLKMSYATTMARPSLRELSGFTYFDYVGDFRITGNQELRPTLIQNLDVRWERYPKKKSVLAAGFFFKWLRDPIELVSADQFSDDAFYRNGLDAFVTGLEFEANHSLAFMGKWAENLTLSENLGFIYSWTSVDPDDQVKIWANDPDARMFRPLFGQAPFVFNTALHYNHPEWDFSVNGSIHVSGQKIVLVMQGATPHIYEKARTLINLDVSKRFAKKFTIRFAINNLLGVKMRQIQSFKGKEYSYRTNEIGRTFMLTFNYLMK